MDYRLISQKHRFVANEVAAIILELTLSRDSFEAINKYLDFSQLLDRLPFFI